VVQLKKSITIIIPPNITDEERNRRLKKIKEVAIKLLLKAYSP